MARYNPKESEPRWRTAWDQAGAFTASNADITGWDIGIRANMTA